MNTDIIKIPFVLRREAFELRSARAMACLALFCGLQFLLALASKAHGRIEDVVLVFQIGGIVGVVGVFDLLAKERDHRSIDLLLIQGISRAGLFAAKWLAMLAFCLLGGLAFGLGNAAGTLAGGAAPRAMDLITECGMVAWLLAVYASVALFFSALFRQAKGALIASILAWMLLRPAVMALMVFNPLGDLLDWSKQQLWQRLAFLPEFAFQIGLEPTRGVPQGVTLQAGNAYLALAVWVIAFSLLAGWIFLRQDEAN